MSPCFVQRQVELLNCPIWSMLKLYWKVISFLEDELEKRHLDGYLVSCQVCP